MDTAALAASFPFTSPDLPRDPADPQALPGVLYGLNTAGPGLVAWDRWAQPNHNSVTLAASGAGKSYLAKLEILRSLYEGTECWVIDPEDEYARLAGAVGGAYVHLGAPGVHLNPFDLPAAGRARPDTLTRRALFIHTVIAVLCGGEPSPAERAALDKAIMTAYQRAGITADPRTWARPAPLLPALATALRAAKTQAATALADRLVPFTEGTHAGLFSAPTTTRPEGHLVVFSLRDVPDELRPAATLLALDTTWRAVSDPARRRRRLITVDEAWLLMRDPEGAKFLFRLAKSARKAWAGLAAVTQDAEDVLSTDLGRAVIANSATQILLRQAPQAIGKVADEFRLVGRGAAAAAVGPPGRGALGGRAVFAGVVPGDRLARRALPVHERPRRDRPDAGRPAGSGRPRMARPGRRGRRGPGGHAAMTSGLFTARPGPSPAPPGGPAGRYLTNPGGYTGHLARLLLAVLEHYGPVAGPLLAVAVTAVIAGRALPAPPAARRLHRGRPAGHRPGPAAGRPGRRGGAVGAPDRAAAPGLGTLVARAAAPGLGVRLVRRRRRRDEHPPVGARHHPARPDRAGRRGRLARRAHRHRPRQPAAAARRGGRRRHAAAGPPRHPAAVDQRRPRGAAAGTGRGRGRPGRRGARRLAGPGPAGHRSPAPQGPPRRPPAAVRADRPARLPAAGPGQPRPRRQPQPGRHRATPTWPPRSARPPPSSPGRSGKP